MEKNLIITIYSIYYLAHKVFRSYRKEKRIADYICTVLRKKYNSIPNKNDLILKTVHDIQSGNMTDKALLSEILHLTFRMNHSQRERLLNLAETLVTFARSQDLNRIHSIFNIERNISYQIKSSVMSGMTESVGTRGIIMATMSIIFMVLSVLVVLAGVFLTDARVISSSTLVMNESQLLELQNNNSYTISEGSATIISRIEIDKFIINGILTDKLSESDQIESDMYNIKGYAEIAIDLREFEYSQGVVRYNPTTNVDPFKVRVHLNKQTLKQMATIRSLKTGRPTLTPNSNSNGSNYAGEITLMDDNWFRLINNSIKFQPTNSSINTNNSDDPGDDPGYASPVPILVRSGATFDRVMNHYLLAELTPSATGANLHAQIDTGPLSIGSQSSNHSVSSSSSALSTTSVKYTVTNSLLSSTLVNTGSHLEHAEVSRNDLKQQIAITMLLNPLIYASMLDSLTSFMTTGYHHQKLYVTGIDLGK